jgi:hypothetical protein
MPLLQREQLLGTLTTDAKNFSREKLYCAELEKFKCAKTNHDKEETINVKRNLVKQPSGVERRANAAERRQPG